MNDIFQTVASIDKILLAMGGLLFLVVVLLFNALRHALASRVNVVEERMRRTLSAGERVEAAPLELGPRGETLLGRGFRALGKIAKPTDEEGMGRLKAKLAHAGFRGDRAVMNYLGVKIVSGVALLGLLLWYNSTRAEPIQNFPAYLILTLIVGFYGPSLWLSSRVADRKQQINRALPDTLDLLTTCVESGLGLDAAVNRVGREIELSAPLLARELMQSALEIQAGSSRGDAFRRMAERTGVEEVRNLSALIVQSEKFGTSMAKTLRIMADGMRIRRMHLAEERAATASVKMTIPMVFCIFPTLLLIILGPALVKMARFFSDGPMGQ